MVFIHTEGNVNSFEWTSTETEQVEIKPGELQTVSPQPLPVERPTTESVEENPVIEQKEIASSGSMEVAASIPSELTYACLLIPRFSDHYLTGDITEDLPKWMKEICISYGWRLKSLTIRPGYMQWDISVPLTANPAHFIRLTRQLTSQKIFEDYPRFKRKNLSADFWAPGFSVVPGNQPQSVEVIDSFIREIRTQQGIY